MQLVHRCVTLAFSQGGLLCCVQSGDDYLAVHVSLGYRWGIGIGPGGALGLRDVIVWFHTIQFVRGVGGMANPVTTKKTPLVMFGPHK